MSNWLRLANKTAIVTGAGSGIGKAIASALYSQKCNVFLTDINEEALESVAATIQMQRHKNANGQHEEISHSTRTQAKLSWCTTDVTSKEEVNDLIKNADIFTSQNNLQLSSILINAAGITKDGFIHDLSEEYFDDVIDTNLKGTFFTCQAFCALDRLEQLCNRSNGNENGDGGSIINIGSIISEKGNIGQTNYAASKGGVNGLTRALAKEMAFYASRLQGIEGLKEDSPAATGAHGIVRVNAILPGFIKTPMTEAVPEENRKQIISRIPLKRFGRVEDIANMALFLSSNERSSYVTGECWECAGGIAI